MPRHLTWTMTVATLFVVFAAEARAQDAPPPTIRVAETTAGIRECAVMRPSWCAPRCRRRFRLELEGAAVFSTRNDAQIPGTGGTRFDLQELTGTGPWPAGRAIFDWTIDRRRRHSLRLTAAPIQYSGTGTLSRPVLFDGTLFAPGVPTEGTFRFNTYRLGYRYALVDNCRWAFRVGATVLLREAKIELRQGARVERSTDLGLVPLLHLDGEYRINDRWRIVADLDGLAAPQGRAFDFALKVHYRITDRFDVGIGYRTIEGGADNDTVYTFAWLHQAVVSVGVDF